MSQTVSQSALDSFTITRRAPDLRADGATRIVHLNRAGAIIDRTVGGVRMRVGVPVAAYRSLVIAVAAAGRLATLTLRHDDGELDVVIGSGEAMDVARSAKAWSSVLGKPIRVEDACVKVGAPHARQRKRAKPTRRSAFARRRKAGALTRMDTCFGGEREIIARS